MERKQDIAQVKRLGYYSGSREILQCGQLLFYKSTGTSPDGDQLAPEDRIREGTFFPFYGFNKEGVLIKNIVINHEKLNYLPQIFLVEPELRVFFDQGRISEGMCVRFTFFEAFRISAILGGGFWDTEIGQAIKLELFHGVSPSVEVVDQTPYHPKLSFKGLSSYFSRCEIKDSDPPGIYYFNKNNDVYAQVLESENQHKPVKVLNRCLFEDVKDQGESLRANLENCNQHNPIPIPIPCLPHSQNYIYSQITSIQALMANSPDDFSALNNYFIQEGVCLAGDADSSIWHREQIDFDEYLGLQAGYNITYTSVSQLHDDFLSQFSLHKREKKKSPAIAIFNIERCLNSAEFLFSDKTQYLLKESIDKFHAFFTTEFNRSTLMSRLDAYQFNLLRHFIESDSMDSLKQQACCQPIFDRLNELAPPVALGFNFCCSESKDEETTILPNNEETLQEDEESLNNEQEAGPGSMINDDHIDAKGSPDQDQQDLALTPALFQHPSPGAGSLSRGQRPEDQTPVCCVMQ